MSSIAVVGGGPMGLATALRLLRAGHEVTVYEADDRLGGMSASFDFGGTKVERYYHFICKTDDPLFEASRELGIEHLLRWTDTHMGFFHKGRLYPWGTPTALLTFPNLSLISKIRYGLHVFSTGKIDDWSGLDRVDAKTWIRRWIGDEAYEVLWSSLFDLKFFEFGANLSASWIGTRIKRVGRSRKSIFQETMGYFEGGSDVLIDAFERAIVSRGGRVRVSSPISEVVSNAGGVTGVRVGETFHAHDAVVSTVPLPYVARIVPQLPAAEKEKILAVGNIGVVCVLLKLSKSISKNFWVNINDPEIQIPGIIEYTNLNPIKRGEHLVYLPYYMPQHHPKYHQSEADFRREACLYLKKLNPAFEESWLLDMHLHRYRYAQPICVPGFLETLPPMQSELRGFFMADTSYYYPEDRSMSESVRVGNDLAGVVADWAAKQDAPAGRVANV